MLQYGTYTHSNRVYTDHEVEVEPMPEILRKLVVERLVERGVFGEEKNEEDARKNLSSGGGGGGGGANDTSRCFLYTSDAADDLTRVDQGGRGIVKKTK